MRAGEMERQGMGRLHRRLGRADLAAVSEVRCAVRELLRYRWREEPAQVAELLLSELVTNALVHTDDGAVVAVSVAPQKLRVEVRTSSRGCPCRTCRTPTTVRTAGV